MINTIKKVRYVLFYSVIALVFVMLLFVIWKVRQDERTVAQNIIKQNFITVQPNADRKGTLSFDLEKKNVVSLYLASAVKNGKFYSGYRHISNDGKREFNLAKRYLLYYPIIATKLTEKEIRENNFSVKQKVSKKDREIISEILNGVRYDEVVVDYNKKYLPTRIKFYDLRKKKWRIWVRYTYPYNDRRTYNKELNECVDAVLNGDFGED